MEICREPLVVLLYAAVLVLRQRALCISGVRVAWFTPVYKRYLPPPPSPCLSAPGAAEVCLTDGDEESLQLTKRNVEDNLPLVNRQSPGGSNGHPAGLALSSGRVVESGIAANTNSSSCSSNADNRRSCDNDGISSSDPGTNLGRDSVEARASGSDKTTGAGKDPSITEAAGLGGAEGDRVPRTEAGELDTGAASEHVVGSENSHGSEFGGGNSGVSHAEDNRDQPPPGVYVRKLRWGCTGDIEACRGGSGPWDVVLGSDIAALPYASAYGDLLRTIVSLVKSESPAVPPAGTRGRLPLPWREGEVGAFDPEADGGCVSGRSPSLSGPSVTSDQECRAEGTGRRVLVLLAHKRRHVSEESFFDKLKGALGPGSCRELAEDEVHVDFRGTGIRLHMFEVGV